jgi:uncharacterized protein
LEAPLSKYFTDFDGKFQGRLSAVIPMRMTGDSEYSGVSAKYDCRIKVGYNKDIMALAEEGMLIGVRNFMSKTMNKERYTLLVISRVWPEHFGLKGISDSTYYPMQFEVIQQSVPDWDTDDKSSMMIQVSTIPVNYDLIIDDGGYRYERGFSYPIIGEEAHLLNAEMIKQMYNQKILEMNGWNIKETKQDARSDPRLGTIKMFELSKEKIPIYVDYDSLVRYHFGVFCFTGGGKSNLLSNIVRRILYHTQDTRIVLFDISSEYPFLLTDVFLDKKIESKIILETKVTGVEQFYASVVKPKEYENDERVKKAFKAIFDQGKVTYFLKPRVLIPTFDSLFQELDDFRKESVGKAHYIDAIDKIREAISDYVNENALSDTDPIDEKFVDVLDQAATEAVEQFKVSDKAGLFAWATTRSSLKDRLIDKQKDKGGMKTEDIRRLIEDQSRLTCISISDPFTIKELVIGLTSEMLSRRKKQFKARPHVLFVFDEAQEFVPDLSSSQGIEKQCSKQVETLLRQGRKYGLGGCISTQRIAHLNTSALQQLHTYFVGTLPRPYDRALVSNTFTIDQVILEKTLEFAPGEWLLSSYIATGIENVPIFIKSDNAEAEVEASLSPEPK